MILYFRLSYLIRGGRTRHLVTNDTISMYLQATERLLYPSNGAKFHVASVLNNKKSYYDVLEISPKATKGQVKKSYYRLSLLYHPDQNKSEAASIKFREILEAYEILGDSTKRKLYDKGLYGTKSSFDSKKMQSNNVGKKASKNPLSTGKTPIYDFDDWSKNHYQVTFERKKKSKADFEDANNKRDFRMERKRSDLALFIIISVVLGLTYIYGLSVDEDIVNR